MSIARVLVGLSQFTAFLMAAGWIAVVYTATFLKGGHPPLSAYVGIAVIVASWILGTIGVIAGLVGLKETARKKLAVFFVCLNAGFLVFSVLINFV